MVQAEDVAPVTTPVLTISAQLDLAAWEHEARGKHGEWIVK